jgi:hypothetical protein
VGGDEVMKPWGVAFALLSVAIPLAGQAPPRVPRMPSPPPAAGSGVDLPPTVYANGLPDIGRFVEQCPTLDPALSQITHDFTIRRNGAPAALPPCSEPVSKMKPATYTAELRALQALRGAYYMDQGQSGHLPWTSGTLYDWMKAKIAGIDVRDDTSFSYCCESFDGRPYVATPAKVQSDYSFTAEGIGAEIALFAHETRHVDGYPHTSCCGIPGGCDQSFDPANLTPYGIQWWLYALWLEGAINVGYQCLAPEALNKIVQEDEGALAGYQARFCTAPPPAQPAPALPGGPCGPAPPSPCIEAADTLCLGGGRFQVTARWQAPTGAAGPGMAQRLTGDTGYFWFFDSSNLEIVIKVLDGCALNGHHWVFAGGLTNVKVTITVTDTANGMQKVYKNPLNTTFLPIQDTAAFTTCP